MSALKDKKFNEMRKWVVQNLDKEPSTLFTGLYNILYTALEPKAVPQAVLIIAGYQYKSAFVADQEINMVACQMAHTFFKIPRKIARLRSEVITILGQE